MLYMTPVAHGDICFDGATFYKVGNTQFFQEDLFCCLCLLCLNVFVDTDTQTYPYTHTSSAVAVFV